jgi:hypothetical protein
VPRACGSAYLAGLGLFHGVLPRRCSCSAPMAGPGLSPWLGLPAAGDWSAAGAAPMAAAVPMAGSVDLVGPWPWLGLSPWLAAPMDLAGPWPWLRRHADGAAFAATVFDEDTAVSVGSATNAASRIAQRFPTAVDSG